jgi:hypothetical protein
LIFKLSSINNKDNAVEAKAAKAKGRAIHALAYRLQPTAWGKQSQ